MENKKTFSYSQAIEELEAIVRGLEQEAVDVDVLAQKVKRAAALIQQCKGKLRATEDEVQKVLQEMQQQSGVMKDNDQEDEG